MYRMVGHKMDVVEVLYTCELLLKQKDFLNVNVL